MRIALLVAALVLAPAHPSVAQENKPPVRLQKILVDNDRVRVTESVFKPGEESPMTQRGYRVTRVLKGSATLLRMHADGRTETLEWKEGGVYISSADHASAQNVGKSEIRIYTVTLR